MLLLDYVIPILSLAVALFSIGVFVYVVVKVREFVLATIAEFTKAIYQVIEPRGENQPSYLGEILHYHAVDIGQTVAQSVQQGITGSMGGTVKRANAEITQQMAAENPEMAQQMAFNSMLPKSMKGNPLVSMFMQSIFKKALGSVGGGNGKNDITIGSSNPNDNMWG